jgi:hypothetical protein
MCNCTCLAHTPSLHAEAASPCIGNLCGATGECVPVIGTTSYNCSCNADYRYVGQDTPCKGTCLCRYSVCRQCCCCALTEGQ